jgi:hypothetical protein
MAAGTPVTAFQCLGSMLKRMVGARPPSATDSVAAAVRDLVLADHPSGWEGTPTELLAALSTTTSNQQR